MATDPGQREGFAARLQNIAGGALAMLQTRLELLGNEIEEEKLRLLHMLLLAQAMVFSAILGVVLAVALLTACWRCSPGCSC